MSLPAIFPSTALRANQPAVRRAASERPVYVTDNGGRNYVFCSEASFDQSEREGEESEAYAARVARIVERGRAGIAAGRYVEGADNAIAKAEEMRVAYG